MTTERNRHRRLPSEKPVQPTTAPLDSGHGHDGQSSNPRDACIHELFVAQAARTPEAIAVEFGGETVTYDALNRRANQLAHHLIGLGVGPEVKVGISLERNLEIVVAVLGVLKAGGAYVPLDPTYPAGRLEFMIEDSQMSILLTSPHLVESLPADHATIVPFEPATFADAPPTDIPRAAAPSNLAYVIYTSGSTGCPKGVLVEHRHVTRLFAATARWFEFDAADVWTLFHSYAFDFSVWEIWGALLHGGRLVVVPYEVSRSPAEFLALVRGEKVTILNQTPSAFRQFIAAEENADDAGSLSLRLVIFGGEALELQSLRPWIDRHGDERPRLVNMYGITETTVHVTYRAITRRDLDEAPGSVIGQPIPDLHVSILDGRGHPVPVGVPGELYVGGAGVARGYLNRPELTAERFVPDPSSAESTQRLYRTGDVGRRLANGDIVYMGRNDEQVKVRGFRIELGEIEAALLDTEDVREAVVVSRADSAGEKELVAYVVSALESAPSRSALRDRLSARLPAYMIPSAIVFLDAMPLSPNGKVDRRALPTPPNVRPELKTAYVAPASEPEVTIAEIYAGVLGIDRVGLYDDFLELGGHSLLATQIVTRVRDVFGIDLSIAAVLDGATPSQLSERLEGLAADGGLQPIPKLPRGELPQDFPLAFSQERAWFMQKLSPDSLAYQSQSVLFLDGGLNVPVLERCLSEIVRRHEIYRSSFPEQNGEPVQRVHPPEPHQLEVVDVQHLPADERETEVQRLLRVRCEQRFDLSRLPLVQWVLYRVDPRRHVLLHVEHHIVHDGWSFHIYLEELAHLYRAYVAGEPSLLPELPIQFADFSYWQREWMNSAAARNQLDFWRRTLDGAPAELELPFDHDRPSQPTYRGRAPRLHLPADLREQLIESAHREKSTLFTTMLAAFFVLLHRYSGQDDVCIGTGIANRVRRETEPLMGMFVNNVTLRMDLSGDPTFRELMAQVHAVMLSAHAHQDVPFDQVVDAVSPYRDARRNPIFQVLFSFQDAPVPDLDLPDLTVRIHEGQTNGSAKFDLNIITIVEDGAVGGPAGGGLDMIWEHASDLFEPDTVGRLMAKYQKLVESVARDPDQPLSKLVVTDDEERKRLLALGRGPESRALAGRSIPELFAVQVAARPDAIAATVGNRQLTYAELDARTNQLAHHLQALGVTTETRVGIAADRSLEMVVGILAILKAGGAYVPLDPTYPASRLALMIEDAAVPLLLTQKRLIEELPGFDGTILLLDADVSDDQPTTAPATNAGPDNLAYVMYTSGSTGRPKGVCVQHRAISRLVLETDYVSLGPEDRVAQAANAAFDAATFEIWGALLNGGRMVVIEKNIALSPSGMARALRDEGVTVMFVTTALFNQLSRDVPDVFASLKCLMFGGEAVDAARVRAVLAEGRPERLLHVYGPTENTTFTTWHEVEAVDEEARTVPIGRPIANTQVYLLDAAMNPVPVGVAGELYTAGDGLARGYLNDAALTAAKFVPNPFGEPGSQMYRTGDQARYRADGTIEFLDRIDHQVKLRGFRIELREIETVLVQCPSVSGAVVLCREDEPGQKRLVAYVTGGDGPPAVDELRGHLRSALPDYMVPSAFVPMDALPLTVNGKVDRRSLPAPDGRQVEGVEHVAPSTETERSVAAIWSTVLGHERIGVHDNFFDLGGHSLLGTQVVSRVRDALDLEVPLSRLFSRPTVAGLATYIDQVRWGAQGEDPTAEPDEASRERGLL